MQIQWATHQWTRPPCSWSPREANRNCKKIYIINHKLRIIQGLGWKNMMEFASEGSFQKLETFLYSEGKKHDCSFPQYFFNFCTYAPEKVCELKGLYEEEQSCAIPGRRWRVASWVRLSVKLGWKGFGSGGILPRAWGYVRGIIPDNGWDPSSSTLCMGGE